jgi:hypothetical protein
MAFIDPEKFRKFCDENQSKLRADMKSYPLDHSNFETWVNNHREGTRARKVAERFRKASLHVSHHEFFAKYDAICAEIKAHLSTNEYDQIFFYVNTDAKLTKSNFWLALYMFPRIFPELPLPPKKLFIGTSFDVLDALDKSKKTFIIVPDDASYSGSQMLDNLYKISFFTFTNMDIMIAVGYISEEAKKKIETEFSESKILICDATEYFFIFQIDEDEDEELSYNKKLYTIYFDHKLPDTISIYQLQYGIGLGFGKEDDFKYVPMSLVKGCKTYEYINENPYVISRGEKSVLDLQSITEKMCPFPPYKKIVYTFRGKKVNFQQLMINEFDIEITCNEDDDYNGINIAEFESNPPINAECYEKDEDQSDYYMVTRYIYKDKEEPKNKKYKTLIRKFGYRYNENDEKYYDRNAREEDEIKFRNEIMLKKRLSKTGKSPYVQSLTIDWLKGTAVIEEKDNL